MFPTGRKIAVPALLTILATGLAGCSSVGEFDETGGISAIRSACPTVEVAAATGNVTLFNPPTSRDARAIDVEASLTNVRSTCNDQSDDIATNITFEVRARRASAAGARDVTLPYFIAVMQGGSAVVAKRVGHVTLHFDAGQSRASATATGDASVSKAAATLSKEVRDKLTEKRKAGDADAATDPLTRPDIRQAVARATFEALVGFQLTDDQLKYNATR
ncbi:hypothetical protein [Sphingomonas sp. GC_Shp_3]|uniref:hypothetical protein n=1 Tax=Sphingomonas sp. GC_Shp_3 TaxID=2937383 RepID=UPI002269B29A|nr:hypothetical protein [Sphingomonas sp. GC_Shp_3]